MFKFSDLSSAEIREITRRVGETMSRRPFERPKYFFSAWPCAQFSREELRAAVQAAWEDTFKR